MPTMIADSRGVRHVLDDWGEDGQLIAKCGWRTTVDDPGWAQPVGMCAEMFHRTLSEDADVCPKCRRQWVEDWQDDLSADYD